MRVNDSFDRHRSMRINRALRNISVTLSFISLVFAVMSMTMLFFKLGDTTWIEFIVSLLCFLLFANLGLHFHVSFKRKD